ncbi:pre-rRNA-processing protein esf1 [Agyrium rufum]|nr:pre-rRNA-processing protein esf1 [Agyrium rufum]
MAKAIKQQTPKGKIHIDVIAQDQHITDPRFASIQTDPRFRLPSKRSSNVKVDKRFAHMLRDEHFSSKAKVDRYGRTLPKDNRRKELERFYHVENEGIQQDPADEDEDVERELRRVEKVQNRKAKGKRNDEHVLSTPSETSSQSSESEVSEDEDEDVTEENEEVFGIVDGQTGNVPTGDISSRLAVVNLDWDNIRASDLLAVFSSFAAGSGDIVNVSVYPSEFGKERMEREEMEGPPQEIFAKSQQPMAAVQESSSACSENEHDEQEEASELGDDAIKRSILKEGQAEDFDPTKLRRYQLERLRYYYAVLTCSSKEVAEKVYSAVDGTEYLTTANLFDLRFIPEEMDFTKDKPRDQCERLPDGYRPNDFVTDALQHSKVSLTWDADDGTRKEVQRRAFGGSRAEIDENDLTAYLGSDSSEEEEGLERKAVVVDTTNPMTIAEDVPRVSNQQQFLDEQPTLSKKDLERKRMRSLLGLADEAAISKRSKGVKDRPIGDMQITFSAGLLGMASGPVFENEPLKEETTVEKYVRKEKERKARRKEKLKAERNGEIEEGEAGVAAATESGGAEREDLGFDDPFFTAPEENRSAAVALRKEQKRQKRAEREAAEAITATQRAELELLVADDPTPTTGGLVGSGDGRGGSALKHFDMTALSKAERLLAKKKARKGKLTEREKEALEAKQKDHFEMDVEDERFKAVFERTEFAIDPSSKNFKDSEGMRKLLVEGRRKRDLGGTGRTRNENKVKGSTSTIKRNLATHSVVANTEIDLMKLADKVKKKTK